MDYRDDARVAEPTPYTQIAPPQIRVTLMIWRISLCCLLGLFGKLLMADTIALKHSTLSAPITFTYNVSTIPPGPLSFSWQYLHADSAFPSTMGRTWRHNFDIRLLRDRESLLLIDARGKAHQFSLTSENEYRSTQTALGSIRKKGSYHEWYSAHRRTTFFGSYPVTIRQQDGEEIQLRYKDNLLFEVFSSTGEQLRFLYTPKRLLSEVSWLGRPGITFSHDKFNRLASSHSPGERQQYSYTSAPPVMMCFPDRDDGINQPQSQSSDRLCEDESSPPSNDFQEFQAKAYGIKIDLRPEQCSSYFDEYRGIDRGIQIERGMPSHERYQFWQPTVRNFPIVDFIDGRQAVAVLSKALDSKSYTPENHPDGLYESILQDAIKAENLFLSKLDRFGSVIATEKGVTTTISSTDIDSLRMELIIQAGQASSAHYAQIERARIVLKQQHDIELLVVHIP